MILTSRQDVIRVLLRKFRVADNPHKYALYERQDDYRGDRCVIHTMYLILKKRHINFYNLQFSKKQVLVSSETAETAGGGEAIGAGCALGKNRRRRGKEVRPPGSSLS